MRIGKSDGYNHMSGTDIKSRMYQTCNMELLQSDLAAFLYFRFVFSILGVLQLYGRTCTAGFKFYFSPQYPLGIELIIECQYETRDGDRITVVVRISSIAAKETVDAVILKTGYHFSISAETEFLVAVIIRSACLFFLQHTLGSLAFRARFIGLPCP